MEEGFAAIASGGARIAQATALLGRAEATARTKPSWLPSFLHSCSKTSCIFGRKAGTVEARKEEGMAEGFAAIARPDVPGSGGPRPC